MSADKPLPAPVGLIALFQVAALVLREFLRLELGQAGVGPQMAKHLSAIPAFVALAVFLWPVVRPLRAKISLFASRPSSWPGLVISSIGIGLAMRVVYWCLLIASIGLGLHGPGDPGRAAGPMFWWHCPSASHVAVSLGVLAVLTPLVEEFISRGLVLHALLGRGRMFAVVCSAALFAVMHAFDNIPFAFLFGLVAGLQVLHQRSLWGPVITHATFNGLITLDWDCLHGIWVPATPPVALGIAAAIGAIIAGAAACRLATRGTAGADRCPPRPGLSR